MNHYILNVEIKYPDRIVMHKGIKVSSKSCDVQAVKAFTIREMKGDLNTNGEYYCEVAEETK